MPRIFLGKQSGSYKTALGVTINVKCDKNYTCSNLFQRYTHTLETPATGSIHVFTKERADWDWIVGDCLTLTTDGPYSNACLKCVDVYFNRYEDKKPLLFVLIFENGAAGVKVDNRYYPRSKFDTEMTSCKTKKIEDLCKYSDEQSILCDLLQENDRLNDVLTYDIMRIATTGGGNGKCTYNCNKIDVTEVKNGGREPKLGDGFKRFKHQPKNRDNGGHKSKPACVTYNCQALLNERGEEVPDVQGQQYDAVTVYFGKRAKRKGVKTCTPATSEGSTCPRGEGGDTCPQVASEGSTCPPAASDSEGSTCPAAPATGGGNTCTSDWQDVPLLLELQRTNGDSGNNPDYYVHRRKGNDREASSNSDQYYWVKLTLQNNGGNGTLKSLFGDILSSALSGGAGTNVQARLAKQANGDGQTTYLTLLLKRLEFDLTGSVVILMDHPKSWASSGTSEYDDDAIERAIRNLEPEATSGNINRLKLTNGHKIGVADAGKQNTCLTDRKYRVVAHDFSQAVTKLGDTCSAGLRFLVPTKEKGNRGDGGGNDPKYAQLKFYPSGDKTKPANLEYKYYSKNGAQNGCTNGQNCDKVYVVFYQGYGAGAGDSGTDQGDPRPLLLCYGGKVYKPKGRDEYDQTWVKVPEVSKCLCQNGDDDSNGKNKDLLEAVTGVVGFLNRVNLWQHPGPSTGEGQPCTNGVSGAAQCQPAEPGTDGTGSTCTYDVDQFQGNQIKVQVTCEAVNANGTSCYKKLTHQPAGMNRSGADVAPNTRFRLGDVEYCQNGGARQGSIRYYQDGEGDGNGELTATNRWAPLQSVSAYFYDHDTKYQDPLLVVLVFAKNGVPEATQNEKECYRLNKSTGDQLAWEKDTNAKDLVDQGDALVKHLDAIRYCLKKVVKVELQRNRTDSYALMGREANKGTDKGDFTPIGTGSGTVSVTVHECAVLTGSHYKCVKHNLTTALKDHQHEVAGLAFTLPGKDDTGGTGGKAIEIPLFSGADGQCTAGATSVQGHEVTCSTGPGSKNGQSGSKITYNQCMGDVCVYFYHGGNSGGVKPTGTSDGDTDTVPLMLRYDGRFYRPKDRDKYFNKWVCVTELCKKKVTQLDAVNLALNRIDLEPGKASKGADYGLPPDRAAKSFDTVRVKVVTQNGPKKPPGDSNPVYERVVHRTKNGFQIGDIKYGGAEITGGITPKGQNSLTNGPDTKIPIANGGHQALVSTNKWNTVVAYYSCSDNKKQLPQLIVILKTDNEVTAGEGHTVTGSSDTAYGYYVLATQSGGGGVDSGSGYEYKWFEVKETHSTPVQLDDEMDFKLLNAAVVLLERTNTSGGSGSGSYGDNEINKAVASAIGDKSELASPGNPGGVNRLTGKNITVKDATDDASANAHKCIKDYWFSAVGHDLSDLVSLGPPLKDKLPKVTLITGLRFLIPKMDNGNKYSQVKLCPESTGDTCSEERHYHQLTTKIRVFFYGSDPRPLLLCYGDVAYRATSKDGYYEKWYKDDTVTNCDCNGRGGGDGHKEKLLKALITTVGFLNKVNLREHPKAVGTGGGTCRNTGATGQTPTSDGSGECKYEVHQFQGSKIQVKVECQAVNGTTAKSCYKKLTHTHNGMNGTPNDKGGNGFRLGDVVHTSDKSKLDYYGDGKNIATTHRWKPLVGVTAYFYDQDREYQDPLLVILEFAKNGGRDNNNDSKECYKLTNNSGNTLTWSKDSEACKKRDADLVTYLDTIRLALTKTIRIRLEFNGIGDKNSYPLEGREAKSAAGTPFDHPINGGGTVQVNVEDCPGCDELNKRNYKCVQHELTSLGAGGLHVVGAVAFTLPGKNGDKGSDDKAIEIPLHKDASPPGRPSQEGPCPTGPEPGDEIKPLLYNSCMGDIYVYFYAKGGQTGSTSDETTDTVPLMLRYNNRFYCPCDRDSYFDKWVCVKELVGVKSECGCPGGGSGDHGDDCQQLANKLDEVNKELNKIDLYPKKGTDYGLPEGQNGGGVQVDKKKFDTVRVKVATQNGPSTNPAYTRVIHRTKNGFQIGDVKYGGKEIAKNGITPDGTQKGGGTIPIANGTGGRTWHKDLVNEVNANTVAVYYSKTDENKKLPQLIVILKTDSEVQSGEQPVKVSGGKYGYYVIYNGGRGPWYQYEYKWFEVSGKEASVVELNDETDFSLLNAAIILLDRTKDSGGTYGDEDIKKAIKTANLKSPGNKDGVNRLTGKNRDITVKDATQAPESGMGDCPCPCKCLAGTGFKVMAHDLKDLVELSGFKKLPSITLITGLRFLIPSMYRKNSYNEIKLCANGSGANCLTEERHYHKTRENKVCVYFYGDDPRPLLLCYNGWAYAPKTINGYFTDWYKAEGVTECGCTKLPAENCKLLEALVRVSDFLNPVKLQIVPGNTKPYTIHWFSTKPIRIKVEEQKATDKFCYNRYTHKHYGIYGDGKGFRLGQIQYSGKCIQETQNSSDSGRANGRPNNGATDKCISASDVGDTKTHKPSPEVVVYYYKKDTDHQHPLLVALRSPDPDTAGNQVATPGQKYSPYFELQGKVDASKTKLYTRAKNGIDLADKNPEGPLAQTLDAILYKISKQLRVVLAERPVAMRYSPDDVKNYSQFADVDAELKTKRVDKAKNIETVAKNATKAAEEARTAGRTTGIRTDPDAIRSSLTHHVLRTTEYRAQLCERDGKPVSPPQAGTTAITVREVDCPELYSKGGYRCFRHLLTTAKNIDQVGGLKLAVFSGQGGGGGPGGQTSAAEITLCPGNDTAEKGRKNEPVQLRYTTCKGDLFVFFYGEDPRPLMLCYNNCAYRPMSMETYCREWVRVTDSGSGKGGVAKPVSCQCDPKPASGTAGGGAPSPRFNAGPLLKALYGVSVELNPVRLCLGQAAIDVLVPQKGQSDQSQPAEPSPTPRKPLEWKYVTHGYPPQCVRVKVTPRDLSCYRRYTHQAEKQGFRLGRVTYACAEDGGGAGSPGAVSADTSVQTATCTASQAGPSGPQATCSPAAPAAPTTPSTPKPFCFPYSPERQLWSVCVYYYMYDKDHKWPLVVELGFRWGPSEFFRLCCKGSNSAQPGNGGCKSPKNLKWVRMVYTTVSPPKDIATIANDSCQGYTTDQNGGDLCDTCPEGGSPGAASKNASGGATPTNQDKQELCKDDQQFAREAEQLQIAIDRSLRDVPVFPRNYLSLEGELVDLIERRALAIRKRLKIDYGDKRDENLILATDQNCHEDSIMAYVVGGGVVSAAGGGGWKAVVMLAGVFVKL